MARTHRVDAAERAQRRERRASVRRPEAERREHRPRERRQVDVGPVRFEDRGDGEILGRGREAVGRASRPHLGRISAIYLGERYLLLLRVRLLRDHLEHHPPVSLRPEGEEGVPAAARDLAHDEDGEEGGDDRGGDHLPNEGVGETARRARAWPPAVLGRRPPGCGRRAIHPPYPARARRRRCPALAVAARRRRWAAARRRKAPSPAEIGQVGEHLPSEGGRAGGGGASDHVEREGEGEDV